MSVALLQNGHKKLNILFNLMIRKRSDGKKITLTYLDCYKLNEHEPSQLDDIYRDSLDKDFNQMIDIQLSYKYNEIFPIVQENLCRQKTNQLFEPIEKIPPDIYNENPHDLYLQVNYKFKFSQELNNPTYLNNNFCNLTVSHPLLPLYVTTNNRGVIHTWSYLNESKHAIDEFFIEKTTKENINKVRKIKKLKFNHYGHEFFVLDDIGNLLFFKFDHNKLVKTPIVSLWSSNAKSSRDAKYMNNSGLVISTSNKNNKHTTIWDFLLPLNQSNVFEFENGGNIVSSYNLSPSILVGNEKPGFITFFDYRRNTVVSSFQVNYFLILGSFR